MNKVDWLRMIRSLIVLSVVTSTVAVAQTFQVLADFDGTNGYQTYAGLVQGIDGNLYGVSTFGGGSNCGFGCGTVYRITMGGELNPIYTFCSQYPCADGAVPHAELLLATDGNFYGTTSEGGASSNCGGGCGTVFKITASGQLTTFYSFCPQSGCPDGYFPIDRLIQGTDGSFYGTAEGGGTSNNCLGGCGTVFRISAAGKLSTLYSFCPQPGCPDGNYPRAGLVQGNDGNFYGTTYYGGPHNSNLCDPNYPGCGTIFKITPAGKLVRLYGFCAQSNCTDGGSPFAGLTQGWDGNFYGTTVYGGANGAGTIFKISPSGKLSTVYSFCAQDGCTDGGNPNAGLVQASDGNLYGTTTFGGVNYGGTIFGITPEGKSRTLYSFCPTDGCPDGMFPYAQLVQGTSGSFYGTTDNGGVNFGGTVFRLSTSLHPFVSFVRDAGKVGTKFGVLGQGLTGTSNVSLNGTSAKFTVVSDTLIEAAVSSGATTGFATVTTPSGTLKSNVPFRVLPQLLSFDPSSGPVGTQVTITGVSLTQTLGVGFGDRKPAQFTVNSDKQVTATVPDEARTGKIGIETKGGVAISQGTFAVTK
ncbi:MAG: hypothetical protein LAO09_11005 [Acidobacteriia bacterium]|nr:hypothetical protein [Terriglobia bacterium]